ncbi:hypothetical protein Dimus_000672, partial [Dionaea muscipula]
IFWNAVVFYLGLGPVVNRVKPMRVRGSTVKLVNHETRLPAWLARHWAWLTARSCHHHAWIRSRACLPPCRAACKAPTLARLHAQMAAPPVGRESCLLFSIETTCTLVDEELSAGFRELAVGTYPRRGSCTLKELPARLLPVLLAARVGNGVSFS